MSNFSKHTLQLLQFYDIVKDISAYCVTDAGKQYCLNMNVECNYETMSARKKKGSCCLSLVKVKNEPPLKFFPPFEYLFQESNRMVTLPIEEIYAIGLFTKSIQALQLWEQNYETKNEITALIQNIPALTEVSNAIFSIMDDTGSLKSIPSLKKIQKQIAEEEQLLKNIMAKYLSGENYSAMLQSTVPTTKDGRQVIAVKSNFKGRIQGIIHEYSQTGATFYLEPADVVEKNNELCSLHAAYDAELLRILSDTSKKIFAQIKEIQHALQICAQLDTIIASCKWAVENNGVFLDSPQQDTDSAQNTEAKIFLKQARHPLLKKPIPIDIALNEKTRVLIITGPNTGGKTVTLKTVALFALLNQAGFPVPCENGSRLPYFDTVMCDIGDEQSIDLSLSTFSAHMKNIAHILETATERSLIVLDELGSGTEPQEGCAIAMAVLDELIERGSYVFVTTHHGALKQYGFTNEACENASVSFDSEMLSPTYKITIGVPGESHAFDIALKNGLSEKTITQAKKIIGNHQTDISALIENLIEKNKTADTLILNAKKTERSAMEKIRTVDLKELKLKQKELELREQGYKRLDTFFTEKRRELENLIRHLREGELSKEKIAETKNWLQTFETDLQAEHDGLETEQLAFEGNTAQEIYENFAAGDLVYVPDYNKSGVILRAEKDNTYLVELGNMKLNLPANKLKPEKNQNATVSVGVELTKSEKPAFELKLLGMREADAKKALINQLDLAAMSNIREFSIVHGKGDGILQKMVHKVLSKNKSVAEFYFAKPEDGGTGKTYVKLV